MIKFTEKDDSLMFTVRVVPRASKSEIVGEMNGALKIRIASPLVENAANIELIKLLSKAFGIAKGDVEIIGGLTSKTKQVKIKNLKAGKLSEIAHLN